MHKKIIAAFGVAGFIMLSYVKVNYAMDYEAALAESETVIQYAEEFEESKLIPKEADIVLASYDSNGDTEDGADGTEEYPDDTPEEELLETAAVVEPESAALTLSQINTASLQALNLPEYNAAAAASSRVVNISQNEYDILLRIVEAEATGKDVLAKILVGNVIINRVNSGAFPGSVEAVVFQKNDKISQFSPMDDGRYYSVTVTGTTVEAVNRVLAGEDYSQGALYFAAERVVDGGGCWASRHCIELFRYGGHVFFGPQS